MYDFIVVVLIAALGIFGNRQESRVLIIFSTLCLTMLLIGEAIKSHYIQYYQYHFLICGLLHYLVARQINKEQKITELIYCISNINLAFIYLNLFGLTTYFFYISGTYFNIGCELLYSFAAAAIIDDWCFDGIWRTRIYRTTSFIRRNLLGSIPQLRIGKKEART